MDDGLFLQTHRFIMTWLATPRGTLLLFTMTAAWPIPPAEFTATQTSLSVLYSWLLLHLTSSLIIFINTSTRVWVRRRGCIGSWWGNRRERDY